MASNDEASDVATYAASVRAALSDLPSDQAEILLEDLEDHLREIAAEAEGSLNERLGPPDQYAQELRTARQTIDAAHRVLQEARTALDARKYAEANAMLRGVRENVDAEANAVSSIPQRAKADKRRRE